MEIQGIDRVLDTLEDMAKMKDLPEAMSKAALLVERDAKKNCPVNDGVLRNSIFSEVEEENTSYIGIVGSNLQYAPYVEYGTGLFAAKGNGRTNVPWIYKDAKGEWHSTSGQKPQPFLIPALDENREQILELIRGGIQNG